MLKSEGTTKKNSTNTNNKSPKITHTKEFLIKYQNSPETQRRPSDLPEIPGVTLNSSQEITLESNRGSEAKYSLPQKK